VQIVNMVKVVGCGVRRTVVYKDQTKSSPRPLGDNLMSAHRPFTHR